MADHFQFGRSIKKVAIVGAGASGLPTARHLMEYGLEVKVFERASKPGGVWLYSEETDLPPTFPAVTPSTAETSHLPPEGVELPYSETYDDPKLKLRHSPPGPVYESYRNNIALPLIEYKDWKWPEGTGWFESYIKVTEYIQSYAEHFGINKITSYDTRVEKLDKLRDGSWRLTLRKLQFDVEKKDSVKATWWTEDFDAVVIASGHSHAPYVPDISGLKDWQARWPQRVWHAKNYRRPDDMKNKNVVIIGPGPTALDISRDCKPYASRIYQAVRPDHSRNETVRALKAGILVSISRSSQIVAEVERFELPPDGEDIRHGKIHLVDGTVLENIDYIILATAYQFTLPFLLDFHSDSATKLSPNKPTEELLVTDGTGIHNLYQDIFYIPDPTLVFVGVPFFIATFSFFEFQSLAIAAVFSGHAMLPTQAAQRVEYESRLLELGSGRDFHRLGPAKEVNYINHVVDWVNRGTGKKITGHPKEWFEVRDKQIEMYKNDLII